MSGASEPSIVVDAWAVSDGSQDEFLAALTAMLERLSGLDGFEEGAIFEGVDRTRFVSYARLRSVRAREAAFLDPEIQAVMRRIDGIARPSPHVYSLVRRFGSPGSRRAAD